MGILCAFGADPGRSLVARRAALGQRHCLWSLLSLRGHTNLWGAAPRYPEWPDLLRALWACGAGLIWGERRGPCYLPKGLLSLNWLIDERARSAKGTLRTREPYEGLVGGLAVGRGGGADLARSLWSQLVWGR